jgi:hypothetical protein
MCVHFGFWVLGFETEFASTTQQPHAILHATMQPGNHATMKVANTKIRGSATFTMPPYSLLYRILRFCRAISDIKN